MAERRAYPKSIQAGVPRLGPLPEGWSVRKLEDLLQVVSRPVTLKADQSYELVTAKRSRGGIISRGRFQGRQIKTKTQFETKAGDFLVSRRQIAHGACGFVTDELDGAIVSNEYASLRPTKELDGRFLRHLSHSAYFQQTCFHSSIGVHVEKLVFDLRGWLKWKFNVPEITEQRRIAALLDEWDSAIARADALTERKELFLRGLVEALIRPARAFIPIANVAVQTSLAAGDDFAEIDVLSCTKREGLVLSDQYFDRQVYGEDRRAYKIVRNGEFAYATNHLEEGSIGRNYTGVTGVVSPMYTTFKAAGINPEFLRFVLKTERMRKEFERHTPASVNRRGGLRWASFSQIEIPSLSDEDQLRIVDIVNTVEADFASQTRLLRQLRLQKGGLMQKLLSGALRVPGSIDRLTPGGRDIDEIAQKVREAMA